MLLLFALTTVLYWWGLEGNDYLSSAEAQEEGPPARKKLETGCLRGQLVGRESRAQGVYPGWEEPQFPSPGPRIIKPKLSSLSMKPSTLYKPQTSKLNSPSHSCRSTPENKQDPCIPVPDSTQLWGHQAPSNHMRNLVVEFYLLKLSTHPSTASTQKALPPNRLSPRPCWYSNTRQHGYYARGMWQVWTEKSCKYTVTPDLRDNKTEHRLSPSDFYIKYCLLKEYPDIHAKTMF